MITASINIGIYTIVFFLLGMYKPSWPLFFMKNPNRMAIMVVTMVGIMVSATLFGEGRRQKELELSEAPVATTVIDQSTIAVPTPSE